MSVPEAVFVAAGYSAAEAKKVKKAFDSQDIQLQHLTNGDVTQDMLRDEFGIGQLGKRLKVLEAARAEFAKQPKSKRKSAARAPAPAPAPEPAQAVSTLRKRKGEDSSQAVAEPAPETTSLSPPDRRSMQQKIMDPKTVQEINEMRSWTVQFADFVSRTLGGARDVVTVGTILLALVYYAALVTDSLPDGWV